MGNSKTKPEPPPKENAPSNNNLSYSNVPFQLQIRNCLRNVRGNSENSFTDVCPDQCAPSTSTRQGPSVYTIDIGDGQMPSNYLNAGYSISETGSKPSHPNDGLPSYEEAVGKTVPLAVAPLAPAATSSAPTQPTHPTVEASEVNETGRGHRHRRHRRHRHHNEEIENDDQQPHDDRRRHRRRGFRLRRHLAKMGRNQSNQQ